MHGPDRVDERGRTGLDGSGLDGAADLPEVEVATGISETEFEQLYEQQLPRVYGYLARRVGATLAEDLAAQTFYEAWVSRDRYDTSRGAAVGWLFGIATNLLRRHRRREDSQLRLMVAAGWRHVAEALADLSPIDRDILALAGWPRLTYEEIAEALGLPIGTVKSRLSRARRHLARRLSPAIDLA
jgi:RNA polymerase sigma-70 factor (ECF subfamily)